MSVQDHARRTPGGRVLPGDWLQEAIEAQRLCAQEWWPRPALTAVPAQSTAEAFGDLLARRGIAPETLAAQLGLHVVVRRFPVEARVEALLVPNRRYRFVIYCHDRSSDRGERVPLSRRVAHELAHTLFYEWSGAVPQRRRLRDAVEERFCDAFAAAAVPDPARSAA